MSTPLPVCSSCGRSILLGAHRTLQPGEFVHLNCPESNAWAGGTRELLCLSCGRAFPSDSKAQRLCRRCRSEG